jgi:hypothetical protein
MNGSEVQGDAGRRGEEALRTLLAEHAAALTPAAAPVEAIRRRGLAARRRRSTVLGAALAVASLGTYWLATPGAAPADGAAALPRVTVPGLDREGRGQLLDGITYEQAARGLTGCLDKLRPEQDHLHGRSSAPPGTQKRAPYVLPPVEDLRVLLAVRAGADGNPVGDDFYVVAVNDPADPDDTIRLQCRVKGDRLPDSGVQSTGVEASQARPVVPDVNSSVLFPQGGGLEIEWKLPFRWGAVGAVAPSVARVSVEYGGVTVEAVLDGGWFVASGELGREVTALPHIKGYDAVGELVYDSDRDKQYPRTLP